MTSADLNIHLSEKWPKWLRTGSLRAVDRRIARPSSFPSFRVRGGHFGPPPWRRWLRPPPGRGLKGVCLLHLSSENIFHVLRSIWFNVMMKQKWIWYLSLCYFSLFCFYCYRLWWPSCSEKKWFNLAHVIQTNFEGVLFPQTNQLANSRNAIFRHLYYKVFK